MRKRKQAALDRLKARARALQKRWGGKLLEEWLRLDLTNAHLLPLVTYNSEIETFRKILQESGGDFEIFFQSVGKMKTPLHP
jgi:predicted aminopeptidase